MKVYCSNCKWLSDNDGWAYICLHKENENTNSNWFSINFFDGWKRKLEIINKKNNCSWYKKKWWKFWI